MKKGSDTEMSQNLLRFSDVVSNGVLLLFIYTITIHTFFGRELKQKC